ncbi:nucleotidyltransferase family protein [Sphingomonas xinjiangensis]|uniref:Molybdenum cofactor cytidylyltransferase n=1 Tax=Sphingomonas xinjiangensis TaxID=643568 RepID=A0A840YLE9_9SPHN|nr:nucleotidyltransferase family protein [Sphingomonas xinjiangensis]MBB5710266.1 molybdenum cofactor cytidylyltransferase [Sphingomonas xinjiangensis]
MPRPERTALVLLAAGRSQRFGAADKLAAPLAGKPLALHAVAALESIPFLIRVAVVSGTSLDFASVGYRTVRNPDPARGQSRSLAQGVAAAQDAGAEAVLVALADMPGVTAAHVLRLFDAVEGGDAIVASSDGDKPSPPALFGQAWFPALMASEGDQGARALIRRGGQIVAPVSELVDVDTPEDLERLRAALDPRL